MSSNPDDPKVDQTAYPRQWFRLVVVYLLIPLILFICGGDLGWWQAWLYSMLILAAGIGGRMWAERRHPGLTAERQNMEKVQSAKAWDKVLAPLMALSVSFPSGHCSRAGSSLWLVTLVSIVAPRARLPFDLARIRFRCVGIDRESLFLQRGAYSGGSRACGV